MTRALRSVRLTPILLLFVVAGCAGSRLAAPPQLSPVGDIAFHATRVVHGIQVLQDVAIQGEAAKALSTKDARAIVAGTKKAGEAGVALAESLRAGTAGATAKAKAVAAIKQALTETSEYVSPETRTTIAPYITVITTALALFE